MKINKIIALLLTIDGVLTLVAGIYFPFNAASVPIAVRMTFASLLIIDAVCYFIAAWGVARNIKYLIWPIVALLIINILGLAFDDFGTIDMLAGSYNLFILILVLFKFKK